MLENFTYHHSSILFGQLSPQVLACCIHIYVYFYVYIYMTYACLYLHFHCKCILCQVCSVLFFCFVHSIATCYFFRGPGVDV